MWAKPSPRESMPSVWKMPRHDSEWNGASKLLVGWVLPVLPVEPRFFVLKWVEFGSRSEKLEETAKDAHGLGSETHYIQLVEVLICPWIIHDLAADSNGPKSSHRVSGQALVKEGKADKDAWDLLKSTPLFFSSWILKVALFWKFLLSQFLWWYIKFQGRSETTFSVYFCSAYPAYPIHLWLGVGNGASYYNTKK